MSCSIQLGAEIPFVIPLVDCDSDPVPLLAGDTFSARFKPPSAVAFDRTFTAEGGLPSSTGRITYDLVSSDLDELGTWEVQATITRGGNSIPSYVGSFTVKANL